MCENGCNVGGEQSGHLILTDYATTGDGLLAALQILAALIESGKPASKTLSLFKPLPQLLKHVRFAKGKPLESEGVRQAISAAETRLTGTGRLVIRKSGTAPLIRVMAEGADETLAPEGVDSLFPAVRQAGGPTPGSSSEGRTVGKGWVRT